MIPNARLIGSGFACSIALTFLLASCGGGSSPTATTPTAPTVTTPTLASLTVACGTGTSTVQCSAVARLSDSSTQTVTTQAVWQSSNTSIATVSAGVVTAVTTGSVTITATYQSFTGQAAASVSKTVTQFALSGTVTDGTSHGPLPNINIETADLNGSLRTTTTNSSGTYSISQVDAGTYTLTASATGYQATSRSVSITGNTQADVVLPRIATVPPGQPPATLTCSGAAVPAIVSCLNNQGNLAPTAQCNDGAFSCSTNKSGTCSGHSGVKCYVCPGPLCG